MLIKVSDVISIDNPRDYKLHLACTNEDGESPLDVYVSDYSEWIGWNQWRGNRNDWTRRYVFSLIEYYPRRDSWLFGGVFEVMQRKKDRYVLKEIDKYKLYVGRLMLNFHRYQGMRGRAFYLERYMDQFEVSELLPQPYSGEAFCGYENINHDFTILETVFRNSREDWKAALSNVKGVYVICDKNNGKMYVGSAYGDVGIWSRWSCYIGTGHGWNDELTRLIKKKEMSYARRFFQFSILEIMSMNTPDKVILNRESHWKKVLRTREHGYNKN